MDISLVKACHIDGKGDLVWTAERSGGCLPADHPSFEAICQELIEAGITIDNGAPLVSLAAVKSALKRQIDAAAEIERLKYITPGAGQAMTYQQKVNEAQAYKAASNPKAADYPILSSEVGITAETLSEVANVVLAAFAQWQHIGAAIESIRLGAKRDIDAAQDEAAARAIVDAIEWPQPAL
ncbi:MULTISPECIES: hypothetical protein [unclassified Brucella]|uniref:hypothetical protein n=1 Tax=unclassified Brucella TaxID=2632610 RepID=UPI00217CE436|nr:MULTISPECIES: hypothetical protein [unclassified Brucella]UWF67372.1 hypothetical protein NYO63_04320 [Brucella sp. 1315]UWF70497.1 hypothetical protein NYO65_04320 [Brucella sp. 2594]